jgi:hypothetical protein
MTQKGLTQKPDSLDSAEKALESQSFQGMQLMGTKCIPQTIKKMIPHANGSKHIPKASNRFQHSE